MLGIRAYNFSRRQVPVANAILRKNIITITGRPASIIDIGSTNTRSTNLTPPGVRTMLTLGPAEAVVAQRHNGHQHQHNERDRVAWQPTHHIDIQRVTQTAIVSMLLTYFDV